MLERVYSIRPPSSTAASVITTIMLRRVYFMARFFRTDRIASILHFLGVLVHFLHAASNLLDVFWQPVKITVTSSRSRTENFIGRSEPRDR